MTTFAGRLYDGVMAFAKAVRRGGASRATRAFGSGTLTGGWAPWSGDPNQQIQEYRNWVYTAVRFRALRRQTPPIVVRYVQESEKYRDEYERRKAFRGGRFHESRKWVNRQKSIGSAANRVGFEMEYLPVDSDPMKLLHDPNDPQIGIDLWFMASLMEDLTGRCYIWKVRNGAGKVKELWYIPTQWVTPRSDSNNPARMIDHYVIQVPTGHTEILDADDIITIGEPSPFGYASFMSPLQAHGLTIDLNNALLISRFNGLVNGSQVGTLIKVPSSMANDPEKMQRFEASLLSRLTGAINYNRPLIAEEGSELVNLTPQIELAFGESSEKMRNNIFAAFDLDAAVMGYANESTYAGSIVTDRNVWKKIVRPYQERRNAILTEKLLKMEFGQDLVAINEWQPEEAPDEKRARIDLMAKYGSITVNEIREEYDREPFEDPRYDEPIGLPGQMRLDPADFTNPDDFKAPGSSAVEDDADDTTLEKALNEAKVS